MLWQQKPVNRIRIENNFFEKQEEILTMKRSLAPISTARRNAFSNLLCLYNVITTTSINFKQINKAINLISMIDVKC